MATDHISSKEPIVRVYKWLTYRIAYAYSIYKQNSKSYISFFSMKRNYRRIRVQRNKNNLLPIILSGWSRGAAAADSHNSWDRSLSLVQRVPTFPKTFCAREKVMGRPAELKPNVICLCGVILGHGCEMTQLLEFFKALVPPYGNICSQYSPSDGL